MITFDIILWCEVWEFLKARFWLKYNDNGTEVTKASLKFNRNNNNLKKIVDRQITLITVIILHDIFLYYVNQNYNHGIPKEVTHSMIETDVAHCVDYFYTVIFISKHSTCEWKTHFTHALLSCPHLQFYNQTLIIQLHVFISRNMHKNVLFWLQLQCHK